MAKLTAGEKAPDFKGTDQNGNPIALKDYKGKKVILYFYPKDDTPGCTAQACNLRDNYQSLIAAGYQVIGVSKDSVKSHKKFETKYELPFPLIADEEHVISDAYGIWGERKFMGRTFLGVHRTTFLINEKGIVHAIIEKPDTKNHTEEVLNTWNR